MAFAKRLSAAESVHAPRGGVLDLEELLGISVLHMQSEDSVPRGQRTPLSMAS